MTQLCNTCCYRCSLYTESICLVKNSASGKWQGEMKDADIPLEVDGSSLLSELAQKLITNKVCYKYSSAM